MENEYPSSNSGETFTVSRASFNYVVIASLFLVLGLILGLIGGRLAFSQSSSIDSAELTRIVEQAVSSKLPDVVADAVSVAVSEATSGMSAMSSSVPTGDISLSRADLFDLVQEAVSEAEGGGNQMTVLADDDPSLGPVDAPVTMVEFSDFNCQFCTRYATQTLQQIIDHYGDQLRIVYRDYPVIGGEVSRVAAMAGNCANEQGKFWEYHRLLFSNIEARDRDAYVRFAGELGLDGEAFAECFDTQRYASEVNLDYIDGQILGIRGTPGFYINGTYVSGALPYNYFLDVIDREMRRAGVEPPARENAADSSS